TEIWLIRRNTRVQPISVPRNSHGHVHDIGCDCGRRPWQSNCGHLSLRKVGHRLEIGFQLPNIPRVKASMTVTMRVVFAFVHAISFNAPLMRIKVEPLATAPLAIATAVTDFASTIGAA